jgi:hypothetical protein
MRLVPSPLGGLNRPAGTGPSPILAGLLGVDLGDLDTIRLGARYHYRPFTVAKPGGGERRILAPSPALKRLQRLLLDNVLANFAVHSCATAFFPGASAVLNARRHARARLVATVDLRDFFESTRAARVRRVFAGWDGESVQTIMRLCTFRDGLPQGAPTSPCLSNLANVGLDERLQRLALRSGAVYTRYGDDLTFSWASGEMPGGFICNVEDLLGWAGYEVQPRKGWRVLPVERRPVVTGVVLAGDGRLRAPWAVRWKTLGLRWRSFWRPGGRDAVRLKGYQGYLAMIERV